MMHELKAMNRRGGVLRWVFGVTATLAVTAGTYEGDSSTAVSGVAPLFVHVDCKASTSTRTTKPFRECLFVQDYGDSGSGNYAYGTFGGTARASRNIGYGAEGGHVYRTPGVYSLVITQYDGGTPVSTTITVTVRDGSADEWAGGRTLLVSSSGTFTCGGLTGTPDTLTTADYPTAQVAANAIAETVSVSGNAFGRGPVRLLFRAGESFTNNAGAVVANYVCSRTGPIYIGSYDDAGVSTARATLVGGAAQAGAGIIQLGKESAVMQPGKGITISDLYFDGTAHAVGFSYGIRHRGNVRWCLVQRCDFLIGHVAWEMSRNRDTQIPTSGYLAYDGLAMVDCTHTGRNNVGDANGLLYNFASRVYVAGCDTYGKADINGSYGSHNLRILWGWGIKVEHSTFRYPSSSRHCLKIHSEHVLPWGNGLAPTGAFTPILNVLRRPFDPAIRGYCAANAQFPVFKCTTAGGLTGANEPVFDTTIGNTTTDNLVVWTCVDPALIAPNDTSWRSDGNKYATTDVVVDACKFIAPNTPRPVDIGASDGDDYSEVIRGVIMRSWWDCGAVGSACVTPAYIMGQEWSLYNNVLDISNVNAAAKFVNAVILNSAATSGWAARDIRAYNNDFYASTSTGDLTGVFMDAYAADVVGKNNVLYFGSALGGRTIVDLAGGVTGSNNTGDLSTVTTDPGYLGALSTIDNWAKNSGSYTKNAGASLPVFFDLFATLRSGTMDTGVFTQ
jgi:hypothetical protein